MLKKLVASMMADEVERILHFFDGLEGRHGSIAEPLRAILLAYREAEDA